MNTATRRTIVWAATLGVLALVFLAYLQPDMMFSLANFIWSCF